MVEAVHALTKLRHENILALSGITTNFNGKVSLVSEWMQRGNTLEYVRNRDVDPRPLVCENRPHLPIQRPMTILYLAPWSCKWTAVSSQSGSTFHISRQS